MPVFAVLFKAIMGNMVALATLFLSTKYALRFGVVTTITALYLGAVTMFSSIVAPMLQALFSTGYGQFIGLAFPPIAGSVVAGLSGLWVTLMGYTYYQRFARILAP